MVIINLMLKSILSTATFKQSQITIIGTIVNGALGAVFYILLARFLGPADFGLLTVSIASLTLIADIADFGTNTGLVRFVSSNINSNKEKALRFLKLSLEIKLAVWILVLVVGIFISPFLAERIFNKPELVMSLRLVMVGVGGALLFTFATSSLQAFQKYLTWSFINIFTNALRLIFIFLLFFYGQLSLTSGLLIYLLLPFFGFSLSLMFIPTKKIISVTNESDVAKEFFKYNFWVALFVVIVAISSRLDTFMTARLLSREELGIYGAANQLVQVVTQLNVALGVVAAPKFASFVNLKEMITYFKKFQLLVLGIALLGMLLSPLAFYVIPLIYGMEFTGTVLPFIILLAAMLIFLISLPVHNSIIYYFGKPKFFVWLSIGHLIIISSLGYILISNYGVIGAASAVLTGTLFNFLVPFIWFLIKVENKK